MSIKYNEAKKLFKLDTADTTYVIGLSPEGYIGHVYYGDQLTQEADNYLLRMEEAPFTPSVNKREKSSFLDFFPMELPTGGIGDYRESCLNIRNEEGRMGCEVTYVSHEIYKGKKKLAGLPASFGKEDEVETLDITCRDEILGLTAVLSYSVFEKENVITRSVRVAPVERTKFLDDCLLMLYFTLLVHVFFQAGITDLLLFRCIGFVVSHIHTNMSLIDLNDFCYDTVQKIPVMGNNQYGS